MSQNYEACKAAFRRMIPQGRTKITASKTIPPRLMQPDVQEQEGLKDEDMVFLPKIRLYEGINTMGPTAVRCLIFKLDKFDAENYTSFCLLKNFRDPAVVTLQDFCEDANHPRIALSVVDVRLDDMVRSNKGPNMFFEDQGRSLSELHRRFIINMCTGLESLFKEEIYPTELKLDDLYICREGSKDACLKMLILSAEKIEDCNDSIARRVKLWGNVKEVVNQIKRITDNTAKNNSKPDDSLPLPLNEVDKRFINYIGHASSMVKNYPIAWSPRQKAEYLYAVIAAEKKIICTRLNAAAVSLTWPVVDPLTNELPRLLSLLIENDKNRKYPTFYSTNDPYHYVLLCRTVHKHYKSLCTEVTALKELCKEREDFLKKMEQWQPDIWCILYDAIGIPDET